MKKTAFALMLIGLAEFTQAQQQWSMNLNNIDPASMPNFGTLSNDPINFFTNNTQQMTLNADGTLKINSLSGTDNSFLKVASDGTLIRWAGSMADNTKVLYGDGTFKYLPFTSTGTTISTFTNVSFGIGIASPAAPLDVNGNAKFSNVISVGKSINIGDASGFGSFTYLPANSFRPPIMIIGAAAGTFSDSGIDMYGPNLNSPNFCSNTAPQPELPHAVAWSYNDVVSQRATATATYGDIRMGHDGKKAFIEVEGTTSPASAYDAPLYINPCSGRNVYVFGSGVFSPQSVNVMSVAGKLNVTTQMQLGVATQTDFVDNSSKLYINSENTTSTGGLKIRQDNTLSGITVINSNDDSNEAIGVYRTTDISDGQERLRIQTDGQTTINTTNANALTVSDANNYSQVNFMLNKNGTSQFLNIGNSSKAISVNNTHETFAVYGNGYTEIDVYSPGSLPNQANGSGRAFAIKDLSGSGRDLFVVKGDGKIYAREVEVSALQSFPDYVFSKDYKLKTLAEVERYINQNAHLPGFEAGEYYEKNGMNVNSLLVKQQEKIEELTLYIIELGKKVEALEASKK
jgi:hypothetical protein